MHLILSQRWRMLAVGLAGALSLVVWTIYFIVSRRPTPAQIEERRRMLLAARGRIIDGNLIGAHPTAQEPAFIVYSYSVAGVRYECSQNVTALSPRTIHLDAPIQVRYSPQNPGNSIVLAETWNGLW